MIQGNYPRRARGLALWSRRPDWIEPMQASPADPRPLGGDWILEPRLEGERCLAWTSDAGVELRASDRRSLTARHAGLAARLAEATRGEAILDGMLTNQGLELFDCLFFEGASLVSLPLLDRRAVLRDTVRFGEGVHLVPHRLAASAGVRDGGIAAGAGIVAKRALGRYVAGRSNDWLAFDCANAQEFVIGGYAESGEGGAALALLIGYYEEGRLRYAGRVSAAYDPGSLTAMAPTLARLRRRTSPFGGAVPGGGHIQWVSPALVAQIGFADWTPAGLPRQPRFISLRHDREPDEVRRAAARG
jgi:bifunctional non-homologous end joining protein LigD